MPVTATVRNTSTRSLLRLFGINLLLIVLFGASATAFVFRSSTLVDETIEDTQIWEQQLAQATNMSGAIARLSIPQVESLRTNPAGEQQRILKEIDDLLRNIDILLTETKDRPPATSLPPSAISLFKSVRTQMQLGSVIIKNTSFTESSSTNGLTAGGATLADTAQSISSQLDTATLMMTQKRDATMASHSQQALLVRRRSSIIGLAALLTGILTAVFGRRFVRSIQVATHQRENDLAEIGEQAAALNYANNKLAQSNRDLMGFAFVASHDLQEPLRKIVAFGDRLETRAAPVLDATGMDYLFRMKNAASRMQQLIEDLLAYSRTATRGAEPKEISLNEVVEGVLSDLEIAVEQSNAIIEVSPLPNIEADPTQIRQLVQNLMANSIKFRKPDVAPRIVMTATQLTLADPVAAKLNAIHPNAKQWWRFSIADNGIGFDQQYADKVFMVFQRLHGRDEFEGSGLGLAVSRRIVERHSGEISVTSQLGEGTIFSFVVPRFQPAATTPEPTINRQNADVLAGVKLGAKPPVSADLQTQPNELQPDNQTTPPTSADRSLATLR